MKVTIKNPIIKLRPYTIHKGKSKEFLCESCLHEINPTEKERIAFMKRDGKNWKTGSYGYLLCEECKQDFKIGDDHY